MFHFRKNTFPSPEDKVTDRTNTHPHARSSPSPTASSIHYNIKSPMQSSFSFDQAPAPLKKRETAAQIRQRKIQEYKQKKQKMWTSRERHYANIVQQDKEEEESKSIPAKAYSYDDAPLGVMSSLSAENDSDSIFRSRSRNNDSNDVLEQDGSDSNMRNKFDQERTTGWNNNENGSLFEIHPTGADGDYGNALLPSSPVSSFDEGDAEVSHVRRLNKHERAAQIRERKLLEYKAKKFSEKHGTNLPTKSPTSTIVDVGGHAPPPAVAMATTTKNNFIENHDSMIQTNSSFDDQPKPSTSNEITRARTTDWNHDRDTTMDIQRTGSDGILIVSDATFDERMKVTRDRAHRLSELYAMQAGQKNDPIAGISNKFESAAQIRQRKIQEYETKQLETGDAIFKVSSSSQHHHGQQHHLAPAGEITRARTTDSSNDDGYAAFDDIHRTGSDGLLFGTDPAFDERSRVSQARSDRLSELYAMQEGRNAIFRTDQKTSIMGKLSYEAKADNNNHQQQLQPTTNGIATTGRNTYETAAQIRERKLREYKEKKYAEGMNRQVALSTSFDSSVILSSEAGDQIVEISLPESYSFDDAGDFVPSVNYDLPSLC